MTLENHIPEDDLVLFALQLLPEDRMRQARQHAESCELCRGEIAKLQGDLVAYSTTAEPEPPPPASRDRLMRQIAREPRITAPEPKLTAAREPKVNAAPEPPLALAGRASSEPVFPTRQRRTLHTEAAEEPERPSRPSRAPWVLAWTGWAVAAGCAFFAGLQLHQRQQAQSSLAAQQTRLDDTTRQMTHAQDALATLTAANAIRIALHPEPPAKGSPAPKPGAVPAVAPEALAAYLADKAALVLVATHLQPPPSGKTYELWLLAADGRNPVPAGTFQPDAQGSASLVMPQLPRGVPAKGFEITLENEGGSGTPTLPAVMAGA
jgi:hypothetical protein